MADPHFFHHHGPLTLAQIAQKTGATLPEGVDPARVMTDVAPLDTAAPDQLSFIDNRKYQAAFKESRAGACFMRPHLASLAPSGMVALVTPTPYKAYALAAQMFYPAERPGVPQISPHAAIHPTAQIGARVHIEHFAVIGPRAVLGDDVWIEAGAVIGAGVTIGAGSRVGAGASVSHAVIGQGVRLYPGCRVGQDGFGFAIDPAGFVKVPQLGRVIIHDFCEIGANTCIDRGAGPDTVIGMGTWIDNLVQIAHNVKIGRGCILVGQVGIAGSTVIDDFVAIGGQAGIAGHLHIEKGVQIAAGSGVINNLSAGSVVMGYPALPKTRFLRHVAYLNRMTGGLPASATTRETPE